MFGDAVKQSLKFSFGAKVRYLSNIMVSDTNSTAALLLNFFYFIVITMGLLLTFLRYFLRSTNCGKKIDFSGLYLSF